MKYRLMAAICVALFSCAQPDSTAPARYFDLKGFFESEASRMATVKATVVKQVRRNELSQELSNILPDWNEELSLFIESDINKPAWKSSYHLSDNDSVSVYTAIDPDLRTRQVRILKGPGTSVRGIRITNRTQNYLYSSSEDLVYVPGKVYAILKRQSVLVLGTNNYFIRAFFSTSGH